jgi:hypothetical protein
MKRTFRVQYDHVATQGTCSGIFAVIRSIGMFMKLKSLVALATVFAAGAASAASFNGSVAAGAFDLPVTTFTFAAGQKALVSFGVGSSPVDILVPITPTLSIPFHYDALTFSGATIKGITDPAITLVDSDLSNGALFTLLTPGTYALKFEGNSATGGVYAGEYNVAIANVPEPTSVALALAGAGLTLLARRRRA